MKILEGKRNALEAKAAEIIAEKINELLETQEHVVFAIPGGRSVSKIFRLLKDANVPWKKVKIFMVDERLVPLADDQSNYKLVEMSLLEDLFRYDKLPEENVYPFVYSGNAEADVKKYEEQLKGVGGKFDLVLLSAGEDCHIASLFPGAPIKGFTESFLITESAPNPPKGRMSATRYLLTKSKVAVLLFFGKSKQEAYNKFMDKKLDLRDCPAKIVQDIKDSYIFTDLK